MKKSNKQGKKQKNTKKTQQSNKHTQKSINALLKIEPTQPSLEVQSIKAQEQPVKQQIIKQQSIKQQPQQMLEQKPETPNKPKKHIKVKRLNAKEAFGEGYTLKSVVQKLNESKLGGNQNYVEYGFQKCNSAIDLQARRDASSGLVKYKYKKLQKVQNGLPFPGSVEQDIYMGEKEFLKLNPSRSYGKQRHAENNFCLGSLNSPRTDFLKRFNQKNIPIHSICGSPASFLKMYQQKQMEKNSASSTPALGKQNNTCYSSNITPAKSGAIARCSFRNMQGNKNLNSWYNNNLKEDNFMIKGNQQSSANLLT